MSRLDEIRREIQALRVEIADRRRRLPAHSVRPHQLWEIEELEERLAALERALREAEEGDQR
ncbi:histidine kinase [Deferrisoma palaeochoriense]